MLTSYTDIAAAITDWLARDDLVSRTPDFILLAEATMQRELDSLDAETEVEITGVSGQVDYALQTGIKLIRSVKVTTTGGSYTLEYLTPNKFGNQSTGSGGDSWYYTIWGETINFFPLLDEDQVATITAISRFVPISTTVATNWILDNFPDAYLYGSLSEACSYIKDVEAEAKWNAKFMASIEAIRVYIEKQKFSSPLSIVSD